ncbi:hypothetical protein CXB51_021846 [Gossypium anomalum]|uniref:Uncharacterized protein n=1 Tax=Gossypium anomalum TaxID=47600 RepID=A0A8J5YJU2_9ROSI|nr:hypothetical protein CXB51_021846 [Gossypium anomalum]
MRRDRGNKCPTIAVKHANLRIGSGLRPSELRPRGHPGSSQGLACVVSTRLTSRHQSHRIRWLGFQKPSLFLCRFSGISMISALTTIPRPEGKPEIAVLDGHIDGASVCIDGLDLGSCTDALRSFQKLLRREGKELGLKTLALQPTALEEDFCHAATKDSETR